jgi:hypothetical protein
MSSNEEQQATEPRIVIDDLKTVGDLIEQLKQFHPRQQIMTQVIAPDGSAWNVPAVIFNVPQSNCGGGLKYVGLQMRCERKPG